MRTLPQRIVFATAPEPGGMGRWGLRAGSGPVVRRSHARY